MPGWVPAEGDAVADVYRQFAEREVRGVSPSYEAICLGVAGDDELLGRIGALDTPKRQPNLLLAAVRFIGGPVAPWDAFRAFTLDRWDDVADCMRTHRTQTNEPRRLTALLPVLAALPQPLALLEVGASAGLSLFPDRYRFAYDNREIGDGPRLACTVTGDVPVPAEPPQVAWRRGLDLNPLDVTSDDDVRWLEALVWPEMTDRVEVLREAVGVARSDPPTIVAGDLVHDLADVVADAPSDATLVVFHTAVLAYVGEDDRMAFVRQVRELDACWLAGEAPGVLPGTDRFAAPQARFVVSRDGTPVALAAPHGQHLEWL